MTLLFAVDLNAPVEYNGEAYRHHSFLFYGLWTERKQRQTILKKGKFILQNIPVTTGIMINNTTELVELLKEPFGYKIYVSYSQSALNLTTLLGYQLPDPDNPDLRHYRYTTPSYVSPELQFLEKVGLALPERAEGYSQWWNVKNYR